MKISNTSPQNIIYTGVAGTGKTFLLQQISKKYSGCFEPINKKIILKTFLESLSWREVICLIFLHESLNKKELLKINDILQHLFFQTKASLNNRNVNLTSTVYSILQRHTSAASTTVNCNSRSSTAYFDKDSSGNWYLLADSHDLLTDLKLMLDDFLTNDSSAIQMNESNSLLHYEHFSFVCFHQSYGYDEFVEGIRPFVDELTGQMRYKIEDGSFLQLCEKAKGDPSNRYAMLIDEINRANVSQVFGELLSLIEPSKRAGCSESLSIKLAYSGRLFTVPNNIDIFATMNTYDSSLISLDSAFRRRFDFVEIKPNSSLLCRLNDINSDLIFLGRLLDGLNHRISYYLGEQYQFGHSYFINVSSIFDLVDVMVKQILPHLMYVTSHNSHILADILLLSDCSWLIINDGDTQDFNTLNPSSVGLNTQSKYSYIINPILLTINSVSDIKEHKVDTLSKEQQYFLSHQAYELFY